MNPQPALSDRNEGIVSVQLHRAVLTADGSAAWQELPDMVAAEAPLTLRVEGHAVAVVMRTPGHDRELTAGFLLTEGVIQSARDIFEISVCPSLSQPGPSGATGDPGDSVDVLLAHKSAFDPGKLTRHVFTSSSCGICSKTDLTTTITTGRILTPPDSPLVSIQVIAVLPGMLRDAQPAFASTGGLHACAWWPLDALAALRPLPAPSLLFEDVGRHNALDKLLGKALLNRQPLHEGLLLLSGRISFELVQKAHAAGIPIIAAVGAPSSLAIEYAAAAGITLCGFVRTDRLNVYTHPVRVGQ